MATSTSRWDTDYEWKTVYLLALGFGLVGLDRWIIAPLFPFMAKDLGLNYQAIGNLVGIHGMVWGVFAVISGLMGLLEGSYCPTSFAATAAAAHPSRRGLLQGLQQSGFALFGFGLGPI